MNDKVQMAVALNLKVGKDQLGVVDLALKSNRSIVETIKEYGGREQASAPAGWQKWRCRTNRW